MPRNSARWSWLAGAGGCGLFGIPLLSLGNGCVFWGFLLALLCGVCLGVAALLPSESTTGRGWGRWLHLGVVVPGVAGLLLVVRSGWSPVAAFSQSVAGTLLFLVIALGLAVCVLALALVSRLVSGAIAALARLVASRQDPPEKRTPPVWRPDGAAWMLEVRGALLRQRTLIWLILGMVLLGGGVATGTVILLHPWVKGAGAIAVITSIALVFGLAALWAFSAWCAARSRTVRIIWQPEALVIEVGATQAVFAFAELDRLLWRTDTEYARIAVGSAGASLEVNVGLVRPAPGVAAGLPALLPEQCAALVRAGLGQLSGSRAQGAPVQFARDAVSVSRR